MEAGWAGEQPGTSQGNGQLPTITTKLAKAVSDFNSQLSSSVTGALAQVKWRSGRCTGQARAPIWTDGKSDNQMSRPCRFGCQMRARMEAWCSTRRLGRRSSHGPPAWGAER